MPRRSAAQQLVWSRRCLLPTFTSTKASRKTMIRYAEHQLSLAWAQHVPASNPACCDHTPTDTISTAPHASHPLLHTYTSQSTAHSNSRHAACPQAQPRRASSSAGTGGFPSLADAPQVAAVLGSTLTSFGKSLFVGTQELVAEVGAVLLPGSC